MANIESTDVPLSNTTADGASSEVPALVDGITLSDLLQKASRDTMKWLFAVEKVPIIKSIPAAETSTWCNDCNQKVVSFNTYDDKEESFHLSHNRLRELQDEFGSKPKEFIIADTYSAVCLLHIPQFADDSYGWEFQQGFANFVLLKEGHIPSSHYRGSPTAEHLWYGRKMPYFLDWLDKEYGEGTIVKLIAAFGAQYDQTAFETVVGESVLSLWERYCKSQGEGESDQAEGESDQGEEESDQGEGESGQGEGESENEELSVLGHDTFSDKPKPTGRLAKAAKALLAIFRACSVTRLRRRIVPSSFTANILSRNRKKRT